jgi:hypothetical protein
MTLMPGPLWIVGASNFADKRDAGSAAFLHERDSAASPAIAIQTRSPAVRATLPMPRFDFIPNGEGDFVTWHDQVLKEAREKGVTDGLSEADITTLETDNAALHGAVAIADTAAAASLKANAQKRAVLKRAESNARLMAGSLKRDPRYSLAKGKGYGIVGPEDSSNLHTMTPKIAAEALPHGAAALGYQRGGADGINLYCQRGSGPMELLRFVTKTEFIDRRPLLVGGVPELRTYEAIFVKDDEEIGRRSASVSVACHP